MTAAAMALLGASSSAQQVSPQEHISISHTQEDGQQDDIFNLPDETHVYTQTVTLPSAPISPEDRGTPPTQPERTMRR